MEMEKRQMVEVTNFSKAFFGAILTLLTLAAAWTVDSTVALKTSNAVMAVNVNIIMDDLKQLKMEVKAAEKNRVDRPEVMSFNDKLDKRIRALERYK